MAAQRARAGCAADYTLEVRGGEGGGWLCSWGGGLPEGCRGCIRLVVVLVVLW